MRTFSTPILACIAIGLLVVTLGEVVYLGAVVPGLVLVALGMLLAGLALAIAHRRVGTRLARVASALTFAFSLTAAAAPSYQAYRLAKGEAFLPQLMVGFMLFAVALVVGSVALRRAGIVSTALAILVPASFVAWLVASTVTPAVGGIAGAIAYGALLLVQARAMQRAGGARGTGAGMTAA